MDTPQVDDFIMFTAGIVLAVTAIAGGLMALYRLLTLSLNKRLDDIGGQLRRNGGTSLRDAVDRIEKKQTEIQTDVRELRTRVDDHIQWHLDKDK